MADSDKTVAYGLTADASGLEKGFQAGADGARNFASNIEGHFKKVGDAFAGVQKQLVVLAAVFAGGAFFKEAINASNQLTGEALKLSRSLALTGTEAMTLNTALGDIGSSADDYIGVFTKFARQIKSNEEGLNDLGIKTRDSNGNLRDSNELFQEALRSVGTYKAGLDQNTYAQTAFGKSIDEVMKLQKLNNTVLEEAKRKNQELGLTLTQDNVAAAKAYKLAMNDVSDVLLAVKKVIGDAVMPIFTDLSNYLASTGPYVVSIFRGAMLGLVVAFHTVAAVVKSVAGIVFESFNMMSEAAGLLGQTLVNFIKGDYSAAYDSANQLGERLANGVKNAFGQAIDNGSEAAAAIKKSFNGLYGDGGGEVGKPKGGDNTMKGFKGDKDKSRTGQWDAELAEQKLAYQERMNLEGSFAQFGKQAELKFWQDKLAITIAGSAENIAVRRKMADLQLSIGQEAYQHELAALQTQEAAYKNNTDAKLAILDRESALVKQRYGTESKEFEDVQKKIVETKRLATEQLKQIDIERAAGARNAAMAELQERQLAADLDLELGTITQQEMLTRQRAFELDKAMIIMEGLKDRERIALLDPDRNVVELERIHQDMEQAERQHQLRLSEIRNGSLKEAGKYTLDATNAMGSGFQRVFQQTLQGSLSLRGVLQGTFQALQSAVTGALAKIAADWLMMQLKNLIFGKIAAASTIAEKSAEAGAGGVASMAAAPFPLNLSAPGFGAAMAAAAMSFAPLASASGGYDIPSTVNPLVQAHASEMILPAKHADVIRNMADSGAAGGGGDNFALHVHAMDAKGVERFFKDHGDSIVKSLKSRQRDFAFPGGKK
jgi:hypothetical protein